MKKEQKIRLTILIVLYAAYLAAGILLAVTNSHCRAEPAALYHRCSHRDHRTDCKHRIRSEAGALPRKERLERQDRWKRKNETMSRNWKT